MTSQEMIDLIKLAVPAGRGDAQALASAAIKMAILRFNKAEQADFNRKEITFPLIANKKDYVIGKDLIFSDATRALGFSDMYVDGTDGNPIEMLSHEQFAGYATNNDTTGKPLACAFHSKSMTLSFWPVPSGAYTIRCMMKIPVEGFDSIPIEAQPELKAMALQEVIALTDPNMAALQAQKAEIAVKSLGTQKWSGQNIPVGRGMDNSSGGGKVSSTNLLGS